MKRLKKIFSWDHLPTLCWVLGSLHCLIAWAKHHGTMFGVFLAGFNMGCAVYWEIGMVWKRKYFKLMDRMLPPLVGHAVMSVQEAMQTAKNLVQARKQAERIDPTKN